MNNEKIALGARAESNGVIIYSKENFERQKIGFKATINSDTGEIGTERIMDNYPEDLAITRENSNIKPKHFAIMIIVLLLLALATNRFGLGWIAISFSYLIAFVWMNSNWAIRIFIKIKKKDLVTTSQAKFHAAAHKVLNAYEKLERVPSLDEVSDASMYSGNCESLYFLAKSTFFLFMDIIYLLTITNIASPFLMFLMLPAMFFFIGERKKMFSKLEKIILLEPGNKEMECAIEALKEYENYQYWRND